MRACPGLASSVPARCSPAPSQADAGSEPLLHPPPHATIFPASARPEEAPHGSAPLPPSPGDLARCSPQRRQGAACDLRGRGAWAGVSPGVGPGTQASPAPAPAAPRGRGARRLGVSRLSSALETASEKEPEEAGVGGRRGAARVPPGCPAPAYAAPSGSFPRAVASGGPALRPPPRTRRGSPLGGPPLPRRRSPWKPGG